MKYRLTAFLALACAAYAQEPQPAPTEESPAPQPAGETAVPERPIEQGTELAIPQAYAEDRYQSTFTKNPFLIKTAAVQQAQASFAEDWELGGIYGRGNTTTALIRNRKTAEFRRVTDVPDKEGFRLVETNTSRSRKDTSVKVAKGNEIATLTYPDTPAAPAPGAATGAARIQPGRQPPVGTTPAGMPPGYVPGRPMTGVQGQPAPTIRQPGATSSPNIIQQPTGGRAVIQSQPGSPVAAPGNVPNPVSRRRVLIPSPTPPNTPNQ